MSLPRVASSAGGVPLEPMHSLSCGRPYFGINGPRRGVWSFGGGEWGVAYYDDVGRIATSGGFSIRGFGAEASFGGKAAGFAPLFRTDRQVHCFIRRRVSQCRRSPRRALRTVRTSSSAGTAGLNDEDLPSRIVLVCSYGSSGFTARATTVPAGHDSETDSGTDGVHECSTANRRGLGPGVSWQTSAR